MDVGKREDRMLDVISTLQRNRNNTKATLDFYLQANMITEEVAAHLWEVLSGVEVEVTDELPQRDLAAADAPN